MQLTFFFTIKIFFPTQILSLICTDYHTSCFASNLNILTPRTAQCSQKHLEQLKFTNMHIEQGEKLSFLEIPMYKITFKIIISYFLFCDYILFVFEKLVQMHPSFSKVLAKYLNIVLHSNFSRS